MRFFVNVAVNVAVSVTVNVAVNERRLTDVVCVRDSVRAVPEQPVPQQWRL